METPKYQSVLETLGLELEALAVDDRGSLVTAVPEGPETASDLPKMVVVPSDAPRGDVPDFRLERAVGVGGTATVWVAAQPSLQRRVAVKELREDRRSDAACASLLREARVTGALEHPNIVPVHALGLTTEKLPVLVMKFIEGTPWRASIRGLYATDTAPPAEDVDRELRIFVQVCNAIHFAHSRGIVHRDVKPDNVMIGEFEEVYVVDWGIALQLDQASELAAGVAGTPGYMAPEMAAGQIDRIGPTTDVYLLGALLHEIVTGNKRHRGETLIERLASSFHSETFDYAPWVPSELAEICNRATAHEQAHRYHSAAELRAAVESFLRHRGSRHLASEARARTMELRALHASVEEVAPGHWDRLATEARFGYRQALHEWPHNPEAQSGLRELLVLLIESELAHENLRAARALIDELDTDSPEIQERVERLEQQLSDRRRDAESLHKMKREADLGVAASRRRRLAFLNAGVLGGGALLLFGLRMAGVFSAGFGVVVIFVSLLSVTIAVGRRSLLKADGNAANAMVMTGILVTTLGVLAIFVVGWLAGITLTEAEALAMVVAALGAGLLAATIDRRLGWSAAMFGATALGVVAWPTLRGLVIAIGGGGAFVLGGWVWRRIDKPRVEAEARTGKG